MIFSTINQAYATVMLVASIARIVRVQEDGISIRITESGVTRTLES